MSATTCGPCRKLAFCGDYPCTAWNTVCCVVGCWIFNPCCKKCCYTTQEELTRKEAKQNQKQSSAQLDRIESNTASPPPPSPPEPMEYKKPDN
jgi:hypothetical protein